MSMMICKHCGETFDEDEIRVDRMHLSGPYFPAGGYWEEDCHCPYCGESDFEEATYCHGCGEYKSGDEFEWDCEYCTSCMKGYIKANPEEIWSFLDSEDIFRFLSDYMKKHNYQKIRYEKIA